MYFGAINRNSNFAARAAFLASQPLLRGDGWAAARALLAKRFAQAYAAGMAPKVHLAATHERTLEHATLDQLLEHAVDREAAERTIKELNALRSSLEKQLE